MSEVNNEKLMSKPLDKGHRDKTTKEITSFKAMLQIAKNFKVARNSFQHFPRRCV